MQELKSWGETATAAAGRAKQAATEAARLLETLEEGDAAERAECEEIAAGLRSAGISVASEAKHAGEAAMESSARATALAEGARKASDGPAAAEKNQEEKGDAGPEEGPGVATAEGLGDAAMRCALYGCGAMHAAEAVTRMEAQVKETLQTVAQVGTEEGAAAGSVAGRQKEQAEVLALGRQLLASALRRFGETVQHAAVVAEEAACAVDAAVGAGPDAAVFAARAEEAARAEKTGRKRGSRRRQGDQKAPKLAGEESEGNSSARRPEDERPRRPQAGQAAREASSGTAREEEEEAAATVAAAAAAREAQAAEEKAQLDWVRKLVLAQQELRELHANLGATQARLRQTYAANPLLLPPNFVTPAMRGRMFRLLAECLEQTCADLAKVVDRGRMGGSSVMEQQLGQQPSKSDGGLSQIPGKEQQPGWVGPLEEHLAWLAADAVVYRAGSSSFGKRSHATRKQELQTAAPCLDGRTFLLRLCALVDLNACESLVREGLLPRVRDILLVYAATIAETPAVATQTTAIRSELSSRETQILGGLREFAELGGEQKAGGGRGGGGGGGR